MKILKMNLTILLCLALSLSHISFGQSLDGYKYITVPTKLKYDDGTSSDKYGVAETVKDILKAKGFIVLDEFSVAPKELLENTCLCLICKIELTAYYNITITLINCKSQEVYRSTGSATGHNTSRTFRRATKSALSKLNSIPYSYNDALSLKIEYPQVEKTEETEESIKSYLAINKLDPIEGIYVVIGSRDQYPYRIGIINKGGKYKAIILESELKQWLPGEVKAIFENAVMERKYSVKYYMSNKVPVEATGMIDNEGQFSIECKIPNTEESATIKFIKMFPPLKSEIPINEDLSKSDRSGYSQGKKKTDSTSNVFLKTTSSNGQWTKQYFLDQFGDKTQNTYIAQRCLGTFSNSATSNSALTVDLCVYYEAPDNWLWLRFDLYEYNHNVTVNRNQFGILTIKTSSGVVSKYTIYRGIHLHLWRTYSSKRDVPSEDDISSLKLLTKLRTETAPIKFNILLEDGSTYNFQVDPQGFDETLKSLDYLKYNNLH
jgi:hypothetical protein